MSVDLILVSLGTAVLALAGVLLLGWKLRRLRTQLQEKSAEHRQALDTVLEMGRRIATIQADLSALNLQKQQQLGQSGQYKAYSQAAELIEQGVPVSEVMSRCQLTKGEAELLSAMTRKSR